LEREIAIKNMADSICNERIQEIEKSLNQGCPDCVNYFSAAVTENLFLADADGALDVKPNLGLKIYLNALKIFGFGKSVEFWYEYQAPRFTTNTVISGTQQELRWNSNLSAVGLSGEFFPLIKFDKFRNGIKASLGYFWTEGNIYNSSGNFFNWEGLKIDLEYFGGLADSRYPFEIFIGATLYQSVSGDLEFNFADGTMLGLGNTQAGIFAGLRYNFWSSPF
jgi:hypothetical protein